MKIVVVDESLESYGKYGSWSLSVRSISECPSGDPNFVLVKSATECATHVHSEPNKWLVAWHLTDTIANPLATQGVRGRGYHKIDADPVWSSGLRQLVEKTKGVGEFDDISLLFSSVLFHLQDIKGQFLHESLDLLCALQRRYITGTFDRSSNLKVTEFQTIKNCIVANSEQDEIEQKKRLENQRQAYWGAFDEGTVDHFKQLTDLRNVLLGSDDKADGIIHALEPRAGGGVDP